MRIRQHFGPAILAAIGLLLPGALAVAADDATIREAVEARLQKEHPEQKADVSVDVLDGEVTLTGTTSTLPVKRRAEKLARKNAEIVHNELRVKLGEPVNDADVIEGVRRAILGYSLYRVFDYVEFSVNDGAVMLQGSVVQPWKKTTIEARVAQVAGVRAIQNDITVQSLSSFDSRLRATLLRRIYGDTRFFRYAHRTHPPIRILVDRGNITLAGWVQSPVEKAVLGNIARHTLSFNVDNQLHVDGEAPAEDSKEESEQS
jgi:osmotically-inducible protein OsmY